MALTINPAGSGTRREWAIDSLIFVLAASVGALGAVVLVLVAATTLGLLVQDTWLLMLSLGLIGIAILREIGAPVPVPYRGRQVPEWWRTLMPLRLASFAYGVVLGFGFATPFTSAGHMAALLAVPFVRSWWIPFAVAGLTGVGRGLALTVGLGAEEHEEVLGKVTGIELTSYSRRVARRAVNVSSALLVAYVLARLLAE